jgi:hypothetical protein
MADAADSKSVGRKAVWVRLPPPALFLELCFQLVDGLLLSAVPRLYLGGFRRDRRVFHQH